MQRALGRRDEVRDYGFADRVLTLRQRAGLTQREVAAQLGISYKSIGAWEGGLSYPGSERLKQLIALYLMQGAFAAEREGEEAAALWGAVREASPRRTVPFDQRWFVSLLKAGKTGQGGGPPQPTLVSSASDDIAPIGIIRTAWGEAPDTKMAQGRDQELSRLVGWVRGERCRLVTILGEAGMGKTVLAARLAHDLMGERAPVWWRSLHHLPAVEEWLSGAIAALSTGQVLPLEGMESRLGQLLELLRRRSGLLVLDGLEAILEPGVPYVRYRAGYEGYGEVLRQLVDNEHQGCVLVTSRELPMREGQATVRVLRLQGLNTDESRALLGWQDLAGDATSWQALVGRYAGNPLALQVVGETISAVFGGDIAAFLAQDVAVFGDIRRLLDEQISRLSAQEWAVLAWLAERHATVAFAELVARLGPVIGRANVVEAVEALTRRSLLDPGKLGSYSLQPVVLEYVAAQMTERAAVARTRRAIEGTAAPRRRDAPAPAVMAESVRPYGASLAWLAAGRTWEPLTSLLTAIPQASRPLTGLAQ